MKQMTKTTDYQDGWNAGFSGKRDKSESYAKNFGYQAGSDYSFGYRAGEKESSSLSKVASR